MAKPPGCGHAQCWFYAVRTMNGVYSAGGFVRDKTLACHETGDAAALSDAASFMAHVTEGCTLVTNDRAFFRSVFKHRPVLLVPLEPNAQPEDKTTSAGPAVLTEYMHRVIQRYPHIESAHSADTVRGVVA